MKSLDRMLSGRRNFDRAEAIGLTREIEASAGENLTRLFESDGNWQRSQLTRARIGDDMRIFKSHAIALQWAAGELADQLEKQPSAEDIRTGRAWSPDRRRGGPYRSRWRNEDGALTREVFDAYTNLRDTCNGCHANFRTAWR
jgi:cytochrome c556